MDNVNTNHGVYGILGFMTIANTLKMMNIKNTSVLEKEIPMDKLKACPFCGGEASVNQDVEAEGSEGFVRVYCNNICCSSMTRVFLLEEDAIKAWNTRTPQIDEDVLSDALCHKSITSLIKKYPYTTPRQLAKAIINRLNGNKGDTNG